LIWAAIIPKGERGRVREGEGGRGRERKGEGTAKV